MKLFKKLAIASVGAVMALGVGIGVAVNQGGISAKADDSTYVYSYDFMTKPGSSGDVTFGDVTWTVQTATNLNNYNSGNYCGVQIGAGSKNGEYRIKSKSQWGAQAGASTAGKRVVKKVELWMNHGGGTMGATVTIGGVQASASGSVKKNSSATNNRDTSKVTYTPAENGSEGYVDIDFVSTSKAGYICAMEITCEEKTSSKALSKIDVTTPPTKTSYYVGDLFNPAGMVVTATYDDNSTEPIEDYTYSPNTALTTDVTEITITYSQKTTTQSIEVTEVPTKVYEKYTSDITSGEYMIVYDDGAMKASITSNRFDYDDVEISNNKISNSSLVNVWTISANGDYWNIYNESVGKYAAATGGTGKGQLFDNPDDNKALWSIIRSNGVFEIVVKNNQTQINLRRNGNYGFACYSTQTGGALSLYKLQSTDPAITGVTISNKPQTVTIDGSFSTKAVVGKVNDSSDTLSTDVVWSAIPANAVEFSKTTSSSDETIVITGKSLNNSVVITAASVEDTTIKDSFTLGVIKEVTGINSIISCPSSVDMGAVISLSDITIEVAYNDGSTEETNPTSVDCNTSSIANAVALTIHFNSFSISTTVNVINPIKTAYENGISGTQTQMTVEGVVTGTAGSNFFIQDGEYALLGYKNSNNLSVGDMVCVTGTIKKYNGSPEIDASSGTISASSHTYSATSKTVSSLSDYNSTNINCLINTGTIVSTGDHDDASTTSQHTIVSTIGGESIDVFVDKTAMADQTIQEAVHSIMTGTEFSIENAICSVYNTTKQIRVTQDSTINIEDAPVSVSSITVSGQKTEYTIGEEFTKPTVTAHYSDGSDVDVSELAEFSGFNKNVAGQQTITVSYTEDGKTVNTQYTVTVTATLVSISVVNPQTSYTVGDEFVKPTVNATYSDESVVDVKTSATFTGYDMSTAGNYTVTVTFEGKTDTFNIVVSAGPTPVDDFYVSGFMDGNCLFVDDYGTIVVKPSASVDTFFGAYDDDMYFYSDEAVYNGDGTFTMPYITEATAGSIEVTFYFYNSETYLGEEITKTIVLTSPDGLADVLTYIEVSDFSKDSCDASGEIPFDTADWSSMSSLYNDLSADAKALLASGEYTKTGSGADTNVSAVLGTHSKIADFLARYDYVVAKYNLNDFLNRGVSSSTRTIVADQSATLVVMVASLVGVSTVGGYFFLRKKKETF